MTNTYRLFIATELPGEVKELLVESQERLRRDRPPVKWVAPEAMHLTLQFLGDTHVELIPQIANALRAAVGDKPAPMLQLGTPGAFPNLQRPSVVWMGVEGATMALGQIQQKIAAALETLGFPREARRFRAHLTLGRVRRDTSPAEQQRLGRAVTQLAAPTSVAWQAERVILYRSELLPGGPRYTECEAITLAGVDK